MFQQAHGGVIDQLSDNSRYTYVQKGHCFMGLDNIRLIQQKYQRVDMYYQKALVLFDKYLPAGHPKQSHVRQQIAHIIQIYRCKAIIALEDYKDCLENYLCALPSDHIDIGRINTDIACTYEQLSIGLETALDYAEKAMNISQNNLLQEHTDNITISISIERI